jgi:polar amino acid transport system substrate-binding protein
LGPQIPIACCAALWRCVLANIGPVALLVDIFDGLGCLLLQAIADRSILLLLRLSPAILGHRSLIEFEVFPGGAERVPALVSGRVDIVVSQFSVFESRAQVLDFSLPYCNSDFSAIVKANSPYMKHKDLNGKVVTTRQGDELKALIVGAIPEAKVEMYPNFSDSFTAFRQGRAEAFFNDSAPARYIVREFPGQFRVILDNENRIDVNQYSIGVKQGEQILLNYINWALIRMRLDGRLETIHKRWLESTELVPGWARAPI